MSEWLTTQTAAKEVKLEESTGTIPKKKKKKVAVAAFQRQQPWQRLSHGTVKEVRAGTRRGKQE